MIKPAGPDALFSIRDLAETFDVTARTLRYYEQKGLLTPTRRGATRLYTAADRARLALILRGKRVGFTLDEIKEMLDLEQLDQRGGAHLEKSLSRFRARIADLKRQREDIEDSIAELEAGCAWMENRLANREPPDDIKRRARAFELLAAARLTEWTGSAPE